MEILIALGVYLGIGAVVVLVTAYGFGRRGEDSFPVSELMTLWIGYPVVLGGFLLVLASEKMHDCGKRANRLKKGRRDV